MHLDRRPPRRRPCRVPRGRPVFCEKPLGRSLGEAEAIAEVVRSAGVASQVGLVLRTAPVFGALGELVAGGVLGRPMAVQWRDDQFFPIQGHYASTWHADREIAGGGTLLEHSIHDVDILRQCFGEIAQLSGLTANFAGHDGIEDTAVGSLRLASGALATMTSVWHDVLSRPSTRRVEVLFEEGFVVLEDDFVGPMTIQTTAGTEVRACPPPGWVRDLPLPDTAVGLSVRQYAAEDRGSSTPSLLAAPRIPGSTRRSPRTGSSTRGTARPMPAAPWSRGPGRGALVAAERPAQARASSEARRSANRYASPGHLAET